MIGEFFKTYPYLFTNLITTTFLLAAGWFALTRTHWKVMMISGLASSPAFLFLVFLENEYWNPVRVGGLVLGFEDFLCSFACGAMVWFVIGLFFGDRISFNLQGKKILKRYLALASLSVTFFLLLCLIKVPGMTSLILTCLIVGAILLLRQRSLWLPILTGFLVFPLFYLGVVKIYFLIWPDFVLQWNLSAWWGKTVFGLPLGEITWSAVFGIYWPLFILFLTNGQRLR